MQSILSGLDRWPAGKAAAQRKRRLFNERIIGMALDRLNGVSFGASAAHP
jgi:hypothetical protein